jgi:anti-anti-sigma factor
MRKGNFVAVVESIVSGVARMKVSGRVVLDCELAVGQVKEEIEACANGSEAGEIIVDLAEAPTIDAAGLGMLASQFSICRAAGVRLVVENPSRFVEESLRVTQLDRFLLRRKLGDPAGSRSLDGAEVGVEAGPEVSLESAPETESKMTAAAYWAKYAKNGLSNTIRRLMKRGINKDEAWDLAEAAWVKGFERLSQLKHPDVLQWWVNRIAIRLSLDEFAERNRLDQLSPEHDQLTEPTVDVRLIDLRRLLHACNSRQFQMLRRVYLDEWSIADVAKEERKSETAVTSELSRARNKLRERLGIPPKAPKPARITRKIAA